MVEVLKVSTKSNPNAVAGALAGILRGRQSAELCVVGAGALNQAIKAVAIARSFVVADGIDLVCVPGFTEVNIEGQPRTALRVLVEDRALPSQPIETDGTLDLTADAATDVAPL